MSKVRKLITLPLLFLIVLIGVGLFLFLQHPQFGKMASGARLERMKQSPNFVNGHFRNQVIKPFLSEGVSRTSIYKDMLFSRKNPDTRPPGPIPSQKTDLKALDAGHDVLIWFGHSSYFVQLDGKRMLVDPVFSDHAAPLSFVNRAFDGTTVYGPDDMPAIDYLFITHDHWDHLDYPTVMALKGKVGKVICSLGVGAHLEHWGFTPDQIIETDWHDRVELGDGLVVHTLPTHHFSGRDFRPNRTLWASYLLEAPETRIYFGGDSAYSIHFAEIGARFGGVDLAILENGQYDERWRYSHMHPDEVLKAAEELGAKALFPVHSGKFSISYHPWDAPLKTITALNQERGQRLITPMIGEPVYLKNTSQAFTRWWEGVQ